MSEKMLSEKDVWNVLQYAQTMQYGIGAYTPEMLNNTLVRLNNNPQVANTQKINKALANYTESSKELIAMNEFMEYTDMLYKRTVAYYSGLLSFDLAISCKNAYTIEDYKSEEYIEDKKRVNKFLDRFDYKAEFRKMLKEVLRRETVFTWLRDDDQNATLQIMPQQYCMLTGYFTQGLLYNFNMAYFLQAGVDIDSYAPVFKDKYRNVFMDSDKEAYKQTHTLKGMNSTFAYWTEVSPHEGAWAFKLDSSNFNGVPFLSALMKDSVMNDTIRSLQKDKRMMEAQKIILGEMPLLNETKTSKPDSFAIDPTTMGMLLSLVRASLSDTWKIGGVPMKEVEEYQYEDKNPNSYNTYLSAISGVGASASRVIYSSDRMSQEELQEALLADYRIVEPLYHQFNNFLDFYINKKTRKYKFRFDMEGSTLPFEQKARQEKYMKLAENGIVLPSYIASSHGVKPQAFEAQLLEAKAMEFKLESIHTKSDDDKEAGAPEKDIVKESGEKSRNV